MPEAARPLGAGRPRRRSPRSVAGSRWEIEAFEEPLPRAFYDRPTSSVARDLIGALLARRLFRAGGTRVVAGRIVETEAYVANDPANHAARGPTPRNASMFLGPGHLYVYRIHQVHCANATTRPGQAVLLRAVEPLGDLKAPTRGPGRLCRAFGLDRDHDGRDLIEGDVRLLPRQGPRPPVRATTRVGIRLAADRPLRFYDASSPFVSRRPRGAGRTGEGRGGR